MEWILQHCVFLLPTVLLAVAAFMYVGVPVLVRFTMKQAARPQLVPFAFDDPSLPALDARDFRAVVDQLGPFGFEAVTAFALPSPTNNTKGVLLLLANRQAKDVATAMALYGTVGETTQRTLYYVSIASRFRDGTLVGVNNSPQVPAIPLRPGFTVGRFPAVRDAARLYRLQRQMVARSPSRDKVLRLDEEFGGDAAAYQAASMAEELEDEARIGYMEPVPGDGDSYRPTWKGAFLMTWKLLWPAKHILLAARDRKARRLLAELEGDSPELGTPRSSAQG